MMLGYSDTSALARGALSSVIWKRALHMLFALSLIRVWMLAGSVVKPSFSDVKE